MNKKTITAEKEKEICADYKKTGLIKLGKKYHMGVAKIREILCHNDVQIREAKVKKIISHQQELQICEDYENMGIRRLSLKYGINQTRIRKILVTNGKKIRNVGSATDITPEQEKEICKDYKTHGFNYVIEKFRICSDRIKKILLSNGEKVS